MKQLLLLLALISPSFAQTPRLDYVRDMTAKTSPIVEFLPAIDYAGMFFQVSPAQPIRKVASLPATCTAVGSASSSNAVLYQGRVYMCTATDTWTAVVTTSTGANLALSNLSSVSINAALIPQSAKDLGAQATPWKDLWLYGGGTFGSHSFRLTGTPTGHRVVTFPDATITVAGSASALTSGRLPYVTTGGLLTDSANATLDSSGTLVGVQYRMQSAPGSNGFILQNASSSLRWIVRGTGTESGANAGYDLEFNSRADDQSSIGSALLLTRSNAALSVNPSGTALTGQFRVYVGSASIIGQQIRLAATPSADAFQILNSSGTTLGSFTKDAMLYQAGVAFASLGTPSNGTFIYCTDCTKATPCAGSGNGALAKRLNGAWDCD